jgi:hypothetical protein
MNIFEAKKAYNDLIRENKKPVITTVISYDISPNAVENLKFLPDGISFSCQINGKRHSVFLSNYDIDSVTELQELKGA